MVLAEVRECCGDVGYDWLVLVGDDATDEIHIHSMVPPSEDTIRQRYNIDEDVPVLVGSLR